MGCVNSARSSLAEELRRQAAEDEGGPRIGLVRMTSGKYVVRDDVNGFSRLSPEQVDDSSSSQGSCSRRREHCIDLYCGAITAASKDQDRFVMVPDLLPGVFYSGVFDGHAQDGGSFAERAAVALPKMLSHKLAWLPDCNTNDLLACKARMTKEIEDVFVSFQGTLAEEYRVQVKIPLEKARKDMEKREGIKLPVCLPMGGTTATTLIASADLFCVAWVGDSRGVLCCVDAETGLVTAQDLTEDHNVESHAAERERAVAAGGAVVGRHIAVDEADGMLQPLAEPWGCSPSPRSCGQRGALLDTGAADPRRHAFIVLASDGVWHHMSSEECVRKIHTAIREELERSEATNGCLTHVQLLSVVKEFQANLEKEIGEKKGNRDDIVMSVATVRGHSWKI